MRRFSVSTWCVKVYRLVASRRWVGSAVCSLKLIEVVFGSFEHVVKRIMRRAGRVGGVWALMSERPLTNAAAV